MKILSIKAAAAAVLLAVPAGAAVSRLVSFQGRLTDTSGTPVTSLTAVVFRLYNVDTGGSALYTETQSVTPDAAGLYNVNIGDVTPLDGVDFSQDLWLSVTVNGEALPGRYRLTAAPYAVYASSAAYASAAPWSGLTGVPSGFTPAANSVTTAEIKDGEILNADVNASAAIAYSKLSLAGGVVNADVSASADISPSKINGGAFQNKSYSFPAGAAVGGSTITATGNLQMPAGATISVGGVTGTLLPSGTMVLSVSACPTGFTEYTNARGFYLVGMPSGGTAAGTVGTAMTDLADATHNHTVTSGSGNFTALGGGTSLVTSVTSPTGSAARSSIAPYIQVRLCVAP